MKNSKKVLIGALLAASTLVGATVATYVVTDNANAIGIKVSPGDTETVEKEGKITLTWGQNSVANVSDLGLGESAKAGELVLKAEKEGDTEFTSYTGLLNVALTDLTESSAQYHFINYLNVYIFKGQFATLAAANTAKGLDPTIFMGKIPTDQQQFETNLTVSGSPSGVSYSVFVELSDAATPYYEIIKTDQVYLTFNWNKASGDTDVADDVTVIYMYDPTDILGNEPKIFAWAGKLNNGEWPGEAMTKVSDHFYSYELNNQLTNIIFSGNDTQTVDLEFDEDNLYWTISSTVSESKHLATKGNVNPVNLADYYITGTINGEDKWYDTVGFVSALAMSAPEAGDDLAVFTSGLSLKNGDSLKVISKTGEYYSAIENCDDWGNWLITADGVYDVYLNSYGQVWVSAHE